MQLYPEHLIQCVFLKLVQDENGNTALIYTCGNGYVEITRVLLVGAAKSNVQNNVSNRKH